MHRVKFHPFAPSKNVVNFIDDFFNKSIGDIIGTDVVKTHPSVNVINNETAFNLQLAAPGLSKADFKIDIEDDFISISVNKEQKTDETTEKYTRREFNFHSFKRKFRLPETVDQSQIKASYEDGILSLELPKVEVNEEDKKRTIEIS